ncbi:MAG: MFS transporter [Planctomycetota bacterium]
MKPVAPSEVQAKWLFVACFVSLVATSFAFGTRTFFLSDLQPVFGLSETQFGEIIGAGLWPFAISIVLFSLVIDRVGYGRAMAFAFGCHVASTLLTIFAQGYWGLYWGAFICALGNGAVEAVINPVVASMFPKAKTKWLTILHAGWPMGIVLGSVLAIALGAEGVLGGLVSEESAWRWKVALVLLPTVIYGVMMLRCRFPVNERVAAGVPYRVMLREVGGLGCLIVSGLIVWEMTRVGVASGWFELTGGALLGVRVGITLAMTIPYWVYVRSAGSPLFVFLTLLMIPLATTELGTDGWIKALMEPAMSAIFGVDGGWVLVYTASIMIVMRFCIGPIVRVLGPLGVLCISAALAAVGIYLLAGVEGAGIVILAATIYGVGQSFFWPTTLGLVAERFPKGGAMTLNTIAGVGMLGVGIIGTPLLGNLQDQQIDAQLADAPVIYERVMDPEPTASVFGNYRKVIDDQVAALPQADQAKVGDLVDEAKSSALVYAAIAPFGLSLCYLGLIVYFKSRGGYRAVQLVADSESQPSP